MFTISSKSFCYFWTDIWGVAGYLCSLSVKHLKVSLHPGWWPVAPLFYDCVRAPLSSSVACWRSLICLQFELLYKLFRESLFNVKNIMSCCWLVNVKSCISPFFQRHQWVTSVAHSDLSPSVFCPFHCLMFFWSNSLSQRTSLLWSTIIVIACMKTHLVSQ